LIVGVLVLLTVASGLLQATVDWLASARRPSGARLAVIATAMAMAIVAARSGGGLVATQGVIIAACFVIWSVGAPRDSTGRVGMAHALDALMVAWLLAFGVWFLGNPIKVPRYQITFAPALIYVALLGLDAWAARFRTWRSGGASEGRVAEILVWTGLALAIVVALYVDVTTTPREPGERDVAYELSAADLAARDPGVKDRVILSDAWPYASWFLRMNVEAMPRFEDPRGYLHELEKRDVDYYFALGSHSFEPTFTAAADYGDLHVLERARPARTDLPRVRYLGDVWQNYLEQVADFSFFLDSNSPAHGWAGSAFLDAYSAEELRAFDAVAAYGFRWRDRVGAEQTLEKYVRDGGVLIIDATGNFSNPDFPLEDTAFLGVATERRSIATDSTWELAPAFTRRHPEIGPMTSTPWLAEDGGAWVGAAYQPLRVVEDWEVLASAGGVPAVAVQTLGNGRVYWLAHNLAWHAFSTENSSESRLVRAVFDDALTLHEERDAR
ncbi:MAG: hypothetical protein U1E22_10525, partial [Coriobacteriia bacterium]|nr:hypothetical protein [Coriobacteriia bacterium]